MANLKEIVEGSINGIAQETIDENTYYNIDMADGGITNAQMADAVLHPELFNVGDVYMCVDSGIYTEKHFYKFTGSAWIDVTTEWAYPMLTGASDPTTATVGVVNQLYRNTTSNKLFVCTAITSGTPDTYTWTAVGGGLDVLTGSSNPTSSTGIADASTNGQIYINTTKNTVWIKIGQFLGGTIWVMIGGFGGSSLTQSNTFVAGKGTATGNNSVAIGNATSTGNASTAIGSGASSGANAIAIGYNAVASNASKSIQLGGGTNSTANSLQIFDDNIYKHDTHTLTVQNAQVNGNNVYGTLTGASAPTTSTVGSVGQFYVEITTSTLYLCTAVTTESNVTTYTWTAQGGGKVYKHNISLNWGYVIIYNNSNTAFTASTLVTYLTSLGYTSGIGFPITSWYPNTGLYANGGVLYMSPYAPAGINIDNIYYSYLSGTAYAVQVDFVSDTVTEL